ncbi:hypothetical protein AVEN_828-1 [Araneus ventricosus]|uniref:Uncharacterized protein n=1 Tax=Araneus ventricosus TaxID=182803 RepID=A0A4Y2GFN4_ARAVE|nr:hypothetical protein AVEN_828-1 [Araneus ventricosus]
MTERAEEETRELELEKLRIQVTLTELPSFLGTSGDHSSNNILQQGTGRTPGSHLHHKIQMRNDSVTSNATTQYKSKLYLITLVPKFEASQNYFGLFLVLFERQTQSAEIPN